MTSTISNQVEPAAAGVPRASDVPPLLLLFTGRTNGRGRRLEGFVAHVLQRRHNHDSFRVRHIYEEERPDLFERFGIAVVPSIIVVEEQRVACRISGFVTPPDLEAGLARWLR